MTVTLRMSSLDDDPEEQTFPDLDAAVTAARAWFLDGYEDDLQHLLGTSLDEDAARIGADLREFGRFYCGRFYETIEIVPR